MAEPAGTSASPPPSARTPRANRACRSCATAKAKCIPRAAGDDEACERCYRLKKTCVMQDPPPKRRRRVQKSTRVDQLERKLDGLVSLLTKEKGSPAADSGSPSSGSGPSRARRSPAAASPGAAGEPAEGLTERAIQAAYSAVMSPPPPNYGENGGASLWFGLGSSSLDRLVDIYRTELTTFFPFVKLPRDATASYLRDKKPFLFLNVVMAASYEDNAFQMMLGEEIMRQMTERLLVRGEKSIHLLQGMLIYISWYHYHHTYKNPQLTTLLLMAIAVVMDLGLNKASRGADMNQIARSFQKLTTDVPNDVDVRPSDQRRALAGCFYHSSMFGMCLGQFDSMRVSPQIEECCRFLEDNIEDATDVRAVILIKLHKISRRISTTLSQDYPTASTLPTHMYMRCLHVELDEFRKALPADLRDDLLLQMEIYSVELYIHEHELVEDPRTATGDAAVRRAECSHACLETLRAFFDAFYALPDACLIKLSIPQWAQLAHAILSLARLTLVEVPMWDQTQYADMLRVPDVILCVIRKMGTEGCPADGSDVFSRFTRTMRRIRAWYESRPGQNVVQEASCAAMSHVDLASYPMDTASLQSFLSPALFDFSFLDEPLW